MILEGKTLKKEILDNLESEISLLKEKPTLVVIEVGNDEASNIYISQKEKMAKKVGINFKLIKLEESIKEEELIDIINKYNNADYVDGIIVQMPLPKHINESNIQNAIDYRKDVDGLTDINAGKLFHKKDSLVACTSLGIIELLKYYKIEIKSKNVVIVGRSNLVSKPLISLFLNEDATVTVCHSKTKDLKEYTKNADILVVAVGKRNLITKDMVKENSVIIDVGINRLEDGKICGDVDFENIKEISSITPVPGGVGQMTVAMIGKNTLKAYKIRRNIL